MVRSEPPGRKYGLESSCQGGKRVNTDVHRQAKTLPAGVVIGTSQLIPVGKTDGVHQDIDLAEFSNCALGHLLNLIIPGNIALLDEGAVDRFCQRFHTAFESFSCIAEANRGTLFVKCLGDTPGDGALVGNTEN